MYNIFILGPQLRHYFLTDMKGICLMKRFCLFLLSLLCAASLGAVYAYGVQANLSEGLLRMHIIANSNSDADQSIKLAVRDEITSGSESVSDLAQIDAAARLALSRFDAEYGVHTELERTYVPEKEYKNIRLPEGMYTCVKVILGEGQGENWWCIAYPPLCFTEEVFGEMTAEAEALLKNRLDEESFRAIVKNGDVNLRFWILEEFQKLKALLSDKY